YSSPLDDFSQEIAENHLEDVKLNLDRGGDGILSAQKQLDSATSVWIEKGLGNEFPGNALNGSLNPFALGSFFSDGSANAAWAAAAVVNGRFYGNRASDFQGPQYQRTEDDKLLIIKDTSNQDKVVFVVDKTATIPWMGTDIPANTPDQYEGSGAGQSDVDLKRDLAKYYLGADQARNNPQNNPVLQGINPTDVPSMLPSTTAPWHRSDADPDPNAPVTITGNAQDGLGVNVSMLGGNQINSQLYITSTNSWSVKTTTTDPHDDAKS